MAVSVLFRARGLCLLPLALALAACDGDAPAGSQIDGTAAGFGNATMQNRMVQSGEMGYVTDLTRRFAASVTPAVHFPFDSAVLTPEAQAILRRQADFIRQFPELRFRVYGHTDLVGSAAYNKQLGLRRAQAVVGYFSQLGISRSRLEAVASFGETQPLVLTQAPNAANRRTVTEVSGFVGHRPGTPLNGKYAAVIFRDYVDSARSRPAKVELGVSKDSAGSQSGSAN